MQKWEYKSIGGWPSESELKTLGAQGWELVTMAAAGHDSKGDSVRAYLKRPVSSERPKK